MRYEFFIWLSVVLLLLTIYNPAASEENEGTIIPDAIGTAASAMSFAESFPVAEADVSLNTLPLDMPAAARYFISGWNILEPAGESENTYAWTKGRRAVVEIPIVMPADRELTVVASPPETPQTLQSYGTALPVSKAEFRWNGVSLGTERIPKAGTSLSFQVPAALQRFGPNRLEIHNNYWVVSAKLGISDDARNRGIGIASLALSPVDYEIRATGPAETAGNTIIQRPGSVLSWFVEVPADGRLSGAGLLSGVNTAQPEEYEGLVTLTLTEDDGRQTQALSMPFGSLCASSEISVDVDLSDYVGRMIGITLSFWMASPMQELREHAANDCAIQWKDLMLRGKREDIDHAFLEAALDELRGKYNVFVILFDTLRADYTETYGGLITASTPHLTELADAGTLFSDCSSNSSWTRTSVTSILSSLTPYTHGVLGSMAALPEELPYLPELLGQIGYKTLCVTNNGIFPPSLGFDRGFDTYFQLYSLRTKGELDELDTPEKMASFVWNRSIAPFLEQAGDDPFFVYLHEVDPHAPWNPVPPYGEKYKYDYYSTLKCEREVTNMLRNQSLPLSNEDLRNFQAGYMAEISFMDGYLGWMRAKLREAGLEENTVVLFISDHGEEFLEHGLIGHYWSQYEESIRVPMIWALPGKIPAGKLNDAHAQLIDIPPTIFDLLDTPIPDAFEGRSLLPYFLLPEETDIATPCYGATRENWRWSVRLGKKKLCKHRVGTIGVPSEQYEYLLFDLEKDPGEQYDLWADQLTTGKALRQMLEWREYTGSQATFDVEEVEPQQELSPEEQEDLRALGYL